MIAASSFGTRINSNHENKASGILSGNIISVEMKGKDTHGSVGQRSATMEVFVVFLFCAWDFVTVLNDPLIAKLKGLFQLSCA